VSGTVELYFDFSSPYTYLASTRVEEIAARHGAEVVWRPILLGPILKAAGRQPLFYRPVEGAHARLDLARWADHLGIPFVEPPVFPVNSLAAARGFHAARGAGKGSEYCRAALRAAWGEGRDLGDARVLREVAAGVGLDTEAFERSLQDPDVKAWLRAEVDEASRRGVFGAPVFFVGGEMFHGNDRLMFVEEALARQGHPSPAQGPASPFNRWFGLRCLSRGNGAATYELIVTERLLNQRGVAHGGAAGSLLDTALGAAVVSGIAPEEWCATLQLSVQFRHPLRPGRVTAHGRMVQRGRRAAFAEGEITDGEGKVLASAQGTWYIWPSRPRP
jgi:uncharacterized protein (TIGR00369 family)